jgi:hypothetical protein
VPAICLTEIKQIDMENFQRGVYIGKSKSPTLEIKVEWNGCVLNFFQGGRIFACTWHKKVKQLAFWPYTLAVGVHFERIGSCD